MVASLAMVAMLALQGSLLRKLLRELRQLRGQILTVSLVVAAGISGLVGIHSTLGSISLSVERYYQQQRFGEVFAHAERIPRTVLQRLQTARGVRQVHARIAHPGRVVLQGMLEPAWAQVISLPPDIAPPLNDVFLTAGRMPHADASHEALVLDAFAKAHGLVPGDKLQLILKGSSRQITVTGTAMSPEFVFLGRRGEFFPDDRTVAAVWLNEDAAQAALNLKGAYNDVVALLQPGTSLDEAIRDIDLLLEPYGGLGAYGRADHPSHALVQNEQDQLRVLGSTIPIGFMAIAAFLLNVVLTRLVQLQRPEIATLKAVGYPDAQIALHFFGLVLVILTFGALLGILAGAWIAHGMSGQYAQVFRFPQFDVVLDQRTLTMALIITLVAGLGGAFLALYRVARLAPAEAMRPPAPASYRRSVLERVGVWRWLGGPGRMIVREIERHPLRFALSLFGLSLGSALLILGRFGLDALDRLIELQFEMSAREDVAVVFNHTVETRALGYMASLPGVYEVEGLRTIPVRFVAGPRYRDSAIVLVAPEARLRRILDGQGNTYIPPPQGMLMSRLLAQRLGIRAGDRVEVHVREGSRPVREVAVVGLVDDISGLQGYMRPELVPTSLGLGPGFGDVALRTDPGQSQALFARLQDVPAVELARQKGQMRRRLEERLGESFGFQVVVLIAIASAITVGVVYNNARVALSMRGRELASLRVLGFTRGEVGFILLGEQALQVFLSLPLGWYLGQKFAALLIAVSDPEVLRFPLVVSLRTYAFATLVVLTTAVASGLLVRRQLDRMDITEVLKSPE